MKYIVLFELIDAINALNNSTGKHAVPCAVDDRTIVINILEGWTEHEQFAVENNLIPYKSPDESI